MGEIILIRHGQANSAANDEHGYDKLSPLGHQQAQWLGDYLRDVDAQFDSILVGSLRRHRETQAGLGELGIAPVEDDRLNEMDYFNLSQAFRDARSVPGPTADEEFAGHITAVMEAWHAAEIMGNETFSEFELRVTDVLHEAARPGRRVLCVTSGGVIGMMLRAMLGLDTRQFARILLPIFNSSMHRIQVTDHGTVLAGFNAVPHLDRPDRAHARTHY
ncbi:MAG: histidine phosphatase family protein [Paracoccaceae bacterium]